MNGQEPMATRVESLANPSRAATPMEHHDKALCIIIDGLENAVHRYATVLGKVRGPTPVGVEASSGADGPEALLGRLNVSTDRLQDLTNELNRIADELNELI